MNTNTIKPWVICIPHKTDNYHKHQFLHMMVPRHTNNTNLKVLDSLSARPILPIFKNSKECVAFQNNILSRYDIHANPWLVLAGYGTSDNLPDRCRMVRVQSHCKTDSSACIDDVSQVPFDVYSNEDVVTAMSLQSNTGFLVINTFEIHARTNLLTLQGVLVESSFADISEDDYVEYITGILEESL